jgi:hypothetical protein
MRELDCTRHRLASAFTAHKTFSGIAQIVRIFALVDHDERKFNHDKERDGTFENCVAGAMACRAKGAVEEGEGVLAAA